MRWRTTVSRDASALGARFVRSLAVYFFVLCGGRCSMITFHAYQNSRETILGMWTAAGHQRRQAPDASLSTAEKNALEFEVLSDVGNELARRLGVVVWRMPDALERTMAKAGIDLAASNGGGGDPQEVPVPTYLLVDGEGTVRNVHMDPDYTKRLETETALGWVDSLLESPGA